VLGLFRGVLAAGTAATPHGQGDVVGRTVESSETETAPLPAFCGSLQHQWSDLKGGNPTWTECALSVDRPELRRHDLGLQM